MCLQVDDPIGTATDASWGPSVRRGDFDDMAEYLDVIDINVGDEVLSPQKDFRIKFFQTDDPDKRGIGMESCSDLPQCDIFLNEFPDNLVPDPVRPSTHVLSASGESVPKYTGYTVEPEVRKTDKARQFKQCEKVDDIFLAATCE